MWTLWFGVTQMLALTVASNAGVGRYGQFMAAMLLAAAAAAPLATFLPKLPVWPLLGVAVVAAAGATAPVGFWVLTGSVTVASVALWLIFLRVKSDVYVTLLAAPAHRSWFLTSSNVAMTAGIAAGTASYLWFAPVMVPAAALATIPLVVIWQTHGRAVRGRIQVRDRIRSLQTGVSISAPAIVAVAAVALLSELVTGWASTMHPTVVVTVVGVAVFVGTAISPFVATPLRQVPARWRPLCVAGVALVTVPFATSGVGIVALTLVTVAGTTGIYLIVESDTADAAVGDTAPALAGVLASWYLVVSVTSPPFSWMLEQSWWLAGVGVSVLVPAVVYAVLLSSRPGRPRDVETGADAAG